MIAPERGWSPQVLCYIRHEVMRNCRAGLEKASTAGRICTTRPPATSSDESNRPVPRWMNPNDFDFFTPFHVDPEVMRRIGPRRAGSPREALA
jgi:hypothetical protein